ncbi:dephospho-CoA kinase [Nonlabens sp.]|uniref:dephospho-CoA kinase n=1 Tax=Nonlabens sp. TaxID=1888209 RepID=UPI003F69EE53
MKIIGITGGIGSGKTTVAKEFMKLNVPVFIADDRSKFLLSHDDSVKCKVKELLGDKAYQVNGDREEANRTFIASKVFEDKELLSKLNAILHPAVHKDFEQFCSQNLECAYVLYEAAILFETGGHNKCDATILVTAALEERIKRVMHRDEVSREDVKSRMDHQWSDKRKLALADFVILNDNIDFLPLIVNNLHRFMLKN